MNNDAEKMKWVEDYNQKEVQFAGRVILGLNGTGVIALLAFLGRIWEVIPDARRIVIICTGGMALGLIAITLSILLRVRSMDMANRELPRTRLQRLFLRWQVYSGLRVVSFLLFVSSVLFLLVGLFLFA